MCVGGGVGVCEATVSPKVKRREFGICKQTYIREIGEKDFPEFDSLLSI